MVTKLQMLHIYLFVNW